MASRIGKMLVILVVTALLAELLARAVAYDSDRRGFATLALVERAFARPVRQHERETVGEKGRVEALRALHRPEGKELLAQFQARYEASFRRLVEGVGADGARLLVCYVPGPTGWHWPSDSNRAFLEALCRRHGVRLVDTTAALRAHPPESVYFMPEDMHLARFGNQLVARALAPEIDALSSHRGRTNGTGVAPTLLGDLGPNVNRVEYTGWRTYSLRTNRQGLRMQADVGGVSKELLQHVLLLGDSFTFGLYLPQEHTYAAFLQRRLPGRLIINAGRCGSTIEDEAALYLERARHCLPDVVVLQFFDNDLLDFFYYMRNQSARDRRTREYTPTAAEKALLER